MPGFAERCRQLTDARADNPWLAGGSVIVQQQAIRDHAQAMARFFAGTHSRPRWRRRGQDEGFRVVAAGPGDVRRLNRGHGEVKVPKVGWVRFRWSRDVPDGVKSYRVTLDRAGRWHVAFAVIPEPVPGPGPGTGEVVGIDRGVAVSAALSTGELLSVPGLSGREAARLRRLQRKLTRAKRGSNRRGGVKAGIARLKGREAARRKDWAEKVPPAYTSQRCSACGHVDRDSRQSQARFRCTACGYAANADVNAARNIAAGHAVKARGGDRDTGPVNREPQPALLSA
jgi:putative transposase